MDVAVLEWGPRREIDMKQPEEYVEKGKELVLRLRSLRMMDASTTCVA